MSLVGIIITLIAIGILAFMIISLFDEMNETKNLKARREELENEIKKLKEREATK